MQPALDVCARHDAGDGAVHYIKEQQYGREHDRIADDLQVCQAAAHHVVQAHADERDRHVHQDGKYEGQKKKYSAICVMSEATVFFADAPTRYSCLYRRLSSDTAARLLSANIAMERRAKASVTKSTISSHGVANSRRVGRKEPATLTLKKEP